MIKLMTEIFYLIGALAIGAVIEWIMEGSKGPSWGRFSIRRWFLKAFHFRPANLRSRSRRAPMERSFRVTEKKKLDAAVHS